ncbi:hypothetical protein LSAT2_006977 [Lamellibrachia satsuma]|nr:hypothetical protein LSAT2_006977 [Lamellibrachia satsuma]
MLRVMRAFRSLRSIGSLAGMSTVVTAILSSLPDVLPNSVELYDLTARFYGTTHMNQKFILTDVDIIPLERGQSRVNLKNKEPTTPSRHETDMTNIVLLLFIILLVFAVSGVTLFGKVIPDRFGDLQTSLFSLFICVTQDGWVDLYNHFQKSSVLMTVAGAAYLFLVIMIGAFVFANLVVAVVVTNLEMAMRDANLDSKNKTDHFEDIPKHEYIDQEMKTPIIGYSTFKDTLNLQCQPPLQLTVAYALVSLRALRPRRPSWSIII